MGFGARPQHGFLFEKSIGSKQFICVKRIRSAAKGHATKQRTQLCYFTFLRGVTSIINQEEIYAYFSSMYAKALNHKFDALSKQIEPVLLHPTTGEQCSKLKWKRQCFQE